MSNNLKKVWKVDADALTVEPVTVFVNTACCEWLYPAESVKGAYRYENMESSARGIVQQLKRTKESNESK